MTQQALENSPYALALLALFGICIYVAFEHLAIFLRRRDLSYEPWFSFIALVYGGLCLNSFLMARQLYTEQGLGVQEVFWVQVLLQIVLLLACTGFIRSFIQIRRSAFFYAVVALCTLSMVLHVLLPEGLFVQQFFGVQLVSLPWGESIYKVFYQGSDYLVAFNILAVVVLAWILYNTWVLKVRKRKKHALLVILGVLVALTGMVLAFWIGGSFDLGLDPTLPNLLVVLAIMNMAVTDELAHTSQLAKKVENTELENHQLSNTLDSKIAEVDTLLAIISLDLRAPLVNVLGFTEDIRENMNHLDAILVDVIPDSGMRSQTVQHLYASIQPSLGYIHQGATRLRQMLDAIQLISRQDRAVLQIEPCSLFDMVQKALDALSPKFQECGAVYKVNPLPFCMGDQEQLTQILSRIFENALEFRSPDRPLELTIFEKPHPTPAYARWVILGISDNGRGFEPTRATQLFNLFHREEPNDHSLGIGLYMARRALWRLSGEIWAESDGYCGSTFWIALPPMTMPNT